MDKMVVQLNSPRIHLMKSAISASIMRLTPRLSAGDIVPCSNWMRMSLKTIAKMAEAGDKGLYDDRNESAVKMAQKIRDAIGDDVLPYI